MTKRLLGCGISCLAAATLLVTAGPPPLARAEPVGELLTRLQGLYQQAEEAAETYNAAEVALKARQAEEERLSSALGRARSALDSERATAGRLAREQYQGLQGGGLSPYLRMLLSGDPQQALDQRRLASREGARRAGVVARLERDRKQAGALADAARKALDAQQSLAARQKEAQREVTGRLKEVERLLAALTPAELAGLGAREAAVTAGAQRSLLDSGRLPAVRPRPPPRVTPPCATPPRRSASRTCGAPRVRAPSTVPG